MTSPAGEDAPVTPRDSDGGGNESQLTRPLSAGKRHHQEPVPVHEALTCAAAFIVALSASDTPLTTGPGEDEYGDKSSTTPIALCKSSQ